VVKTALRLLDEVGLDGLTLRRLAQELGVQAPALYWHVKNKQSLLDHMASAVMLEDSEMVEPAPGEDWGEWLATIARDRRRRLLGHRDGARLVAGTRPLGTLFPVLERTLAALHRVGFAPVDALRTVTAIGFYVSGFVQEEQAEQARLTAPGADDWDRATFVRLVTDQRLPYVVSALMEGGDPNGEESFEFGLRLIIDGARSALARQERPAPPIDHEEAAAQARALFERWTTPK